MRIALANIWGSRASPCRGCSRVRIGIVTGMPQELAAFAPGAESRIETVGGVHLRTLDWAGHRVTMACAGIGKVAAATAATLLQARGAEWLVVIGTAAAIGDAPAQAWAISHAVQHDYGARRPNGFGRYTAGTIPVGPERIAPFAAAPLPGPALPAARIASGDMFVESSAHAVEIAAALDCRLIDMETAAVAQVALLTGLPWSAIKATTDAADEDSAATFEANLLVAAHRAARAAEAALGALPAQMVDADLIS